jgi:hypothetical protein
MTLYYGSTWLKIGITQLLKEVSHIEFQLRKVYRVCDMEKPTYGLMQTSLYYGSIWLKNGPARQLLVNVSHIESVQRLLGH